MISNQWQILYFKPKGPIVLIGRINHWKEECIYQNIFQTLSQCDMNPGGTRKTRKLARRIIEQDQVVSVRFWKNTAFVSVSEIKSEQAKELAEKVREMLEQDQF